jgi:hypothetical protein
VVHIGDIVGERGELRFEAWPRRELQRPARVEARDRRCMRRLQRAVVLDETLQRFPGEIEPVEFRVAMLKPGHEAQPMRVVIEAADRRRRRAQRLFARMAERCVAKVVRERERFGQILVKCKHARKRAGDLCNFE